MTGLVPATIARLAALNSFKTVKGALQLSELLSGKKLPQNLPAAYVLIEQESAKPNSAATGLSRQQVITRLGVNGAP